MRITPLHVPSPDGASSCSASRDNRGTPSPGRSDCDSDRARTLLLFQSWSDAEPAACEQGQYPISPLSLPINGRFMSRTISCAVRALFHARISQVSPTMPSELLSAKRERFTGGMASSQA